MTRSRVAFGLLACVGFLFVAPTAAHADECGGFPGVSFFRFGSDWRAQGPGAVAIANAFKSAHDGGVRGAGFQQNPLGEADIGIRGNVTVTIHSGNQQAQGGRENAEGPSAPDPEVYCTVFYTAQVAWVDNAELALNLRGEVTLRANGTDTGALAECAAAAGAQRGTQDGRAILDRLRQIFEQRKLTIHTVLLVPDYEHARAVTRQISGAKCVESVRETGFTQGPKQATQVLDLKSGLTAERLIPHLRAAAPQMTLTFRGSAYVSGQWKGGEK